MSDRSHSQDPRHFTDPGATRLEHPSRAQEATVHYTPERPKEAAAPAQQQFILKRAGTAEFWVDVKSSRSPLPDEQSEVSVEISVAPQPSVQLVDHGGDYHDSAVLGFRHDDRAVFRTAGGSPQRSPRASAEYLRTSDLAVTAVKLDHPVSAAVDKKAEGQYVLYRERTPLRTDRRSGSPPHNRGAGHPPTEAAHNTVGKKGMAYSHSDGMLLGANAMIHGTKVKMSANTGRAPVRGTGDDAKDDASAGGDTVTSTLSPILFNLQPKPASPPAIGAPHLSYSLDSPSGSHSGFRTATPGTPGGALTSSLELDSRYGRDSRIGRQRSHSKDIHLSNPNSRPETPADEPTSGAPYHYAGIRVPTSTPGRRHLSGDNSESLTPSHAPVSSQSYRDYKSSASAARIISEIAGESYYYTGVGTNPHTGSNSVAGTLSAGGSLVVGEDQRFSFPSEKIYGSALDNSLVHAPPAGLEQGSLTLSPSPSASGKQLPVSVKNLVFSCSEGEETGAGFLQRSASPKQLSRPISPLPFPSVVAGPSGASVKSAGDPVPTIVVLAKQAKAPSLPANIVTAEARRPQEATGGLDLLVVPQSMSTLAKINDRSLQKQNRPAPAAANGAAAIQSKAQKQQIISAAHKAHAASTSALPDFTAGFNTVGVTDADSVPSAATLVKVAAPVSKVEFSRSNTAESLRPQRPVSAPLQNVEPPMDAEAQARLEAEMEADIEQELRQILNQHHKEDAQEAYRQAYYQQNKEYLAQAGVAMQEPPPSGFVQPHVPFLAGSSHNASVNTNVSAQAFGITSLERVRMSSSIGGGGFSGRGQGVLHKVKGSHVTSTTLLPPLDPSLALSGEYAFPVTPIGTRKSKHKSRKDGQRETHNITDKLLASSDQLVHNKLRLAALLHHTTGNSLDAPSMTDSINTFGSMSAKLPSSSFNVGVGYATMDSASADASGAVPQGKAPYKPRAHKVAPVRTTVSLSDVAMSLAAGMKSETAQSALHQQQLAISGGVSQSRRDSAESLGSVGSLPLQSLHAPAVAVTHHSNGGSFSGGSSGRPILSNTSSAKLSGRK
jgi:hypothetical protein